MDTERRRKTKGKMTNSRVQHRNTLIWEPKYCIWGEQFSALLNGIENAPPGDGGPGNPMNYNGKDMLYPSFEEQFPA